MGAIEIEISGGWIAGNKIFEYECGNG